MFDFANFDLSFVKDLPKRACQGPCRGLFIPVDPRHRFCPACHAAQVVYVPAEYLAADADPLERQLGNALKTALANNTSDGTPLQKALAWAIRKIAIPVTAERGDEDASVLLMWNALYAITCNVFAKLNPVWDEARVTQIAREFLNWAHAGITEGTSLKPEESPGWRTTEPVVVAAAQALSETLAEAAPNAVAAAPAVVRKSAVAAAPAPMRVPAPAPEAKLPPAPQQPSARGTEAKPAANGQPPKFTPESVRRILLREELGQPRRDKARWIRERLARQSERYTVAEVGAIIDLIEKLAPPLALQPTSAPRPMSPPAAPIATVASRPLSAEELRQSLGRSLASAKRPGSPAAAAKQAGAKPQPASAPKRDDQPSVALCITWAKQHLETATRDEIIALFTGASRSEAEVAQFTRELDAEIARKHKHEKRMASAATLANDRTAGEMRRAPEPKKNADAGKKNKKKDRNGRGGSAQPSA
jgi:hypothetical protein